MLDDVKKWLFGKDFLVSFLRSSSIAGDLQIADSDAKLTKNAVVLVKLPDDTDQQKRQELIRKARAAQAAAVLLLESEANKKTRETGSVRLPNPSTRIEG